MMMMVMTMMTMIKINNNPVTVLDDRLLARLLVNIHVGGHRLPTGAEDPKTEIEMKSKFQFLLDFCPTQISQSECHTCRSTVAATSCSGVQREQRVQER